MTKAMIFIDGSWLYANLPALGKLFGSVEFRLDYGKLPTVLGEQAAESLGLSGLDIVRTCLFGSHPSNLDPQDTEAAGRRTSFFEMLRDEFSYEVETYRTDYRGRRLRRDDRDPLDEYAPEEKCVDIALASSLLYYACIPYAYDVALPVLGDRDFTPALRYVRRLGKRVVLASIKGSCAREYWAGGLSDTLVDGEVIWLEDHLDRLELKYERQRVECKSPLHVGDRVVYSDYRPRRGRPFYCDACRSRHSEQQHEYATQSDDMQDPPQPFSSGLPLSGRVKSLRRDRGYGFISHTSGREYFFHMTDLVAPLTWETAMEGMPVTFEVRSEATSPGRAGAAARIRPLVTVP
jgi:cold shock CspA family protein